MKRQAGALLSSIRLDRSSDRRISVQLYMALRELLLSGGLAPGERLPATRTLAGEVGVSRTTAIDAVERLVSEGLLVSRVGAGTFVNPDLYAHKPLSVTQGKDQYAVAKPRLSHAAIHAAHNFVDRPRLPHRSKAFATALPALDVFPMAHWARLSARHWRAHRDEVTGYGHAYGHPPLRTAIAQQLNASRGIKCDAEQIFIVNGAQQAFSLISAMMVNPGENVWFENPGAIGARNAFVANGANLVPVDVDEEGMRVQDGLKTAPHFRLAFVTPSHQQPLGHVMSLRRRLALLQAAQDADAMIVEDDYDGEFYYGDQPPPTLKNIDTQERVIYVGTFSKTLFPALRLGFVLAPRGLASAFETICETWMNGVPTFSQAVTADFMNEGLFATHIRAMRQVYKERHDTLISEAQKLRGTINVETTSSGFHTIGWLSSDWEENALAHAAAENGVIAATLNRYALKPIRRKGLVLGFGATSTEEIRRGINILHSIVSTG